MALISCPECEQQISDKATKCPGCGARIRKPKRGFFGTIFKWLFIAFNLLMIFWLISYFSSIGDMAKGGSDAEQVGTAIGATIGTGFLASIWVVGDIILGMLVLFTRARD